MTFFDSSVNILLMLIIRLQRLGRRNEPTFRIVLTDSKNGPKSGRFLEVLGSYDARDKNITKIDGERVKELISKGAQVSDTVRNFLISQKILEGKKINVLPRKTPIEKEKTEEAAVADKASSAEAPVIADEKPVEEKPTEEPVQKENEIVENISGEEKKEGGIESEN